MTAMHGYTVTPGGPRPRPGTVRLAAKDTMRAVLGARASALGLTPAAAELIVSQCQVTDWREDVRIFQPAERDGLAYFLVSGAVRLEGERVGSARSVIAYVPPGHFLGSPLPVSSSEGFTATAHVRSLVAVVSHSVMRQAIESLPLELALRFVAQESDWLRQLIVRRYRLGTSLIPGRLLAELSVLARDFGRPEPEGMVINLPLTHEDLAEIVSASRANVTRALGALRRHGDIEVADRRFVLCRRAAAHADAPAATPPA